MFRFKGDWVTISREAVSFKCTGCRFKSRVRHFYLPYHSTVCCSPKLSQPSFVQKGGLNRSFHSDWITYQKWLTNFTLIPCVTRSTLTDIGPVGQQTDAGTIILTRLLFTIVYFWIKHMQSTKDTCIHLTTTTLERTPSGVGIAKRKPPPPPQKTILGRYWMTSKTTNGPWCKLRLADGISKKQRANIESTNSIYFCT